MEPHDGHARNLIERDTPTKEKEADGPAPVDRRCQEEADQQFDRTDGGRRRLPRHAVDGTGGEQGHRSEAGEVWRSAAIHPATVPPPSL
ncbi:MAG: hypothetical protein ACK5WM_20970 [Rhodospirillales bacterium]